MKHPKAFYLIFIWVLIINNNCTDADGQLNDQLNEGFPKRTKVSYRADSTDKVVMIYDYDAEFSKLQFRPVEIQNPSGNYIKDALQAFIYHNHFLGPMDKIRLEKIDQNENNITIHLSGLADSKEQKDKQDFFIKALELTVARNFQSKDFKIVLHEDFP